MPTGLRPIFSCPRYFTAHKETLTTILVSNTKKKHLFAMDVQQLCTMNFGISVDSIPLYVRLADYWNFYDFFSKIQGYFKASKIVNCELKQQPDLEFDFYGGSCNSFTHPEPKILLCFDYDHSNECHT